MRQKQSPLSYSKLKSSLLVAFIVALAFTGLYLFDQYFKIRRIEIVSPGEKFQVNGLENFRQQNSLLVSEEEISKAVTRSNPQLRNIKVEKKYPDQLVISAESDRSIAALKVNQGFFFLNQKGKILSKNKNNSVDLPQINFYQQLSYSDYNHGDQIDLQNIITSLHFSQKSKDMGLQVLSIDIAGVDMIRLNLSDKRILAFSTGKDLSLQDYQFERLIRQFKIEGQGFVSLDFRFDKPIIKLK